MGGVTVGTLPAATVGDEEPEVALVFRSGLEIHRTLIDDR
jgi:hypothetical protein